MTNKTLAGVIDREKSSLSAYSLNQDIFLQPRSLGHFNGYGGCSSHAALQARVQRRCNPLQPERVLRPLGYDQRAVTISGGSRSCLASNVEVGL